MPLPVHYKIEILDNTLTPITRVQAFWPLNSTKNYLEYGDKLSQYGTAKFRIGTKDGLFVQFGDILQPYINHVRITRSNAIVWQGVIINNTHRTKRYIEIEAFTYLYMLSAVLIKPDTIGADADIARNFISGTLAAAIQTILTETVAKVSKNNILTTMTAGVIDNPNYPPNFIDNTGAPLTGPWVFSADAPVKFYVRDVLSALQAFGVSGVSDFQLTDALVLNFQKFIGTKQPDLMFEYGPSGSIEDYDVPLMGSSTANSIFGFGISIGGEIVKASKTDPASISKYGLLEGVAAYKDTKSVNDITVRLTEQLLISSTPDTEINITLNDKAYPLGSYGLGDIITVRIKDHIIDVRQLRRIVGFDVKVHETGRETTRLITNKPRDNQ